MISLVCLMIIIQKNRIHHTILDTDGHMLNTLHSDSYSHDMSFDLVAKDLSVLEDGSSASYLLRATNNRRSGSIDFSEGKIV